MGQKHNWRLIRQRYVQASPPLSLRQIAKEEGVAESSIFRHASRENWVKEREQYQCDIAARTRRLGVKKDADDRLDILDKAAKTCHALTAALLKIAQRVQQADFQEDIQRMEASKLLERLASLSTAFDKLARGTEMLRGNPDHRTAVTLAELVSQAPPETTDTC